MIELVVNGAAGRMGRRLIALAQEDPRFQLAAAIEKASSKAIGKDAGLLAGLGPIGVLITADVCLAKEGQLVIDFSTPETAVVVAEAAVQQGASLVCGTTGLFPPQLEHLRQAAEKIPLLYSPNMSVGVNIMFVLARQMARLCRQGFDREIMEAHHRHKKDVPSGTALKLADILAQEAGDDLRQVARVNREGVREESRPSDEIGIQAIRGGDITGEHTLFFCGEGERLELTHRATSRDIFVRGALRAAAWLSTQPPGYYSMTEVLEAELSSQ